MSGIELRSVVGPDWPARQQALPRRCYTTNTRREQPSRGRNVIPARCGWSDAARCRTRAEVTDGWPRLPSRATTDQLEHLRGHIIDSAHSCIPSFHHTTLDIGEMFRPALRTATGAARTAGRRTAIKSMWTEARQQGSHRRGQVFAGVASAVLVVSSQSLASHQLLLVLSAFHSVCSQV